MEPHPTTSTVSIDRRDGLGAFAGAGGPPDRRGGARRRGAGRDVPALKLRSVSRRTHTLVLTGELTHRSANELEMAIERLCEEGVTAITLDLRQLEFIDPTGVAVIAFRSRLCARQGYGFELIAGSRFIHRAFEQAGAADLPFRQEDLATHRLGA